MKIAIIGQQDFANGSVVGLLLLTPAVITFGIDWLVQRKQTAMLSARAVPYRPKPARAFDALMLGYVGLISALMLAMLGMASPRKPMVRMVNRSSMLRILEVA